MEARVLATPLVALHVWVLLTAGCGREPSEAPTAPPPRPASQPSEKMQKSPPSLYDDEGRLRASDDVVVGVRLPVGLTALEHMPRGLHAYRSEQVPADKLIEYFGPLLFTGEIERVGGGLVYKRAVPMDQRDSPVPVDVSVTPLGPHSASVKMQEHTQPLRTPVPVHELEKILRQEQKRLE